MKELRLNKGEKELVALAKKHGFEEWSYKSWRKHSPHADYSLTKSMVNKGEWSVVKRYCTGTKVKITSKDIEDISYYVIF